MSAAKRRGARPSMKQRINSVFISTPCARPNYVRRPSWMARDAKAPKVDRPTRRKGRSATPPPFFPVVSPSSRDGEGRLVGQPAGARRVDQALKNNPVPAITAPGP